MLQTIIIGYVLYLIYKEIYGSCGVLSGPAAAAPGTPTEVKSSRSKTKKSARETVKDDIPTAREPADEAPKAEEPKGEAPKAEEPKPDAAEVEATKPAMTPTPTDTPTAQPPTVKN